MTELDDTRLRLLKAATAVFAEHGYHAATTREICRVANANLAAIHYHFGDKAELYREVFKLPFQAQSAGMDAAGQADIDLQSSLTLFYRTLMTDMFGDSQQAQQFMRLHAREESEPSGVLGDVVAQAVRPNFEQLKMIICRELKMAEADIEIDRLAFCLVGMAKIFFNGKCVVNVLSPALLETEQAMQRMIAKLVIYASNLIATEAALRRI